VVPGTDHRNLELITISLAEHQAMQSRHRHPENWRPVHVVPAQGGCHDKFNYHSMYQRHIQRRRFARED
jgi:hypothetical protein